ncbi:hypothetical protein V8E54_003257 [Elaphomyces granulatus]
MGLELADIDARKARGIVEIEVIAESLDSIIRRVSRDTRWHAFLFHGKYYWAEILSQYFLPPGKTKDNLLMDDDEVLRAKVKIFDTVKNIKSDTLKKFDSHVAQALKDYPEPAAMDLTIIFMAPYATPHANLMEVDYHKGRRHNLYLQCIAEPNFDNVVKSEFHEIETHVHMREMNSARETV